MRFKTSIKNISVLTSKWHLFFLSDSSFAFCLTAKRRAIAELASCLSSIGKLAWLKLDENEIRFTLMPETSVQVFACVQPVCPQRYSLYLTNPPPPAALLLKSAALYPFAAKVADIPCRTQSLMTTGSPLRTKT